MRFDFSTLDRQMWLVFGPILVFTLFWIVAFFAFKIDMKVRGQTAFDPRIEGHKPSFFISRDFLLFFVWLGNPIKRAIIGTGLTPNTISWVSMICAAAGAVAAADGWFAPAGMLFIAGGLFDVFDGWVARQTNQVSAAGSFLDSILDRVSEAFMFGGYIVYYSGRVEALVALTALGASQAFSYARAKGEALGLGAHAKGGMMGRPERIVSLSAASILAPTVTFFFEESSGHPAYYLFSVVLLVVAIFCVWSLTVRAGAIYAMLKQRSAGN